MPRPLQPYPAHSSVEAPDISGYSGLPSFLQDILGDPLLLGLSLLVVALIVFLGWLLWFQWRTKVRFVRTFGFPPEPRFHYKESGVRETLATLSGDELQRAERLAGICGYESCTSIGNYKPPGS